MQDSLRPSANYIYPKAKSSSHKILLSIIGITSIVALIVTVFIITFFAARSNDEENEINYTLSNPGETTTMLQIYAAIDSENPTISDLERSVYNISQEATIQVDRLGIGYITLPNTNEQILFDYYEEPGIDPETGESMLTSDEDGIDPTSRTITPLPDKTIRRIRYTHPLVDEGYWISYSEEDGEYTVFNLTTTFEYATKTDAIEAYLAPYVVEQQ